LTVSVPESADLILRRDGGRTGRTPGEDNATVGPECPTRCSPSPFASNCRSFPLLPGQAHSRGGTVQGAEGPAGGSCSGSSGGRFWWPFSLCSLSSPSWGCLCSSITDMTSTDMTSVAGPPWAGALPPAWFSSSSAWRGLPGVARLRLGGRGRVPGSLPKRPRLLVGASCVFALLYLEPGNAKSPERGAVSRPW